jgi:hypothetical protein
LRGVLAAPRAHVVRERISGQVERRRPFQLRGDMRDSAGLLARSLLFLPSFGPTPTRSRPPGTRRHRARPDACTVACRCSARGGSRPGKGTRPGNWEEASLSHQRRAGELSMMRRHLAWKLSPRLASPPDIQPSHHGHQPALSSELATSPSAGTSEQMAPNNSRNDAAGARKRPSRRTNGSCFRRQASWRKGICISRYYPLLFSFPASMHMLQSLLHTVHLLCSLKLLSLLSVVQLALEDLRNLSMCSSASCQVYLFQL